MTNKPMLSVERELIQRIADHCKFWVDHPYLEAIADVGVELRALLDKQVNFLTPDCPDCACVQDGQCLCIPSKPAAQHQPAPVAFVIDIESAAKKLAQCMDYPWEYMPEQGRQSMREHAKAVVEASMLNGVKP